MDKKFKVSLESIVPGKLPFLRSAMYLVYFQSGEFQILHLSFQDLVSVFLLRQYFRST